MTLQTNVYRLLQTNHCNYTCTLTCNFCKTEKKKSSTKLAFDKGFEKKYAFSNTCHKYSYLYKPMHLLQCHNTNSLYKLNTNE